MASDSRAGMVRSAALLIGSQGVTATSFSDVLADSGAPRGSIYHHFPDGKRQLAGDAISWTSEQVLSHLRACPAGSAAELLDRFIDLWRRAVVTSGGATGCAVAGVAVDTRGGAALMAEVRAAFRSWIDQLASRLEETGVPAQRARPVAQAVLAGLEGALILCRAEGSSEPLEAVARELLRLLPDSRHDHRGRDADDDAG